MYPKPLNIDRKAVEMIMQARTLLKAAYLVPPKSSPRRVNSTLICPVAGINSGLVPNYATQHDG